MLDANMTFDQYVSYSDQRILSAHAAGATPFEGGPQRRAGWTREDEMQFLEETGFTSSYIEQIGGGPTKGDEALRASFEERSYLDEIRTAELGKPIWNTHIVLKVKVPTEAIYAHDLVHAEKLPEGDRQYRAKLILRFWHAWKRYQAQKLQKNQIDPAGLVENFPYFTAGQKEVLLSNDIFELKELLRLSTSAIESFGFSENDKTKAEAYMIALGLLKKEEPQEAKNVKK